VPTYQGLELCTIRPNRSTVWETQVNRPVYGFETPVGNVVTTTIAEAREQRTIVWGCTTRAERAAVETFLATLGGQRVACWMPDPQWQFPVIANAIGSLTIRTGGSTAALCELVLNNEAWTHWLGRVPNDYQIATVTVATDNGDGTCTWGYSATGAGGSLSPTNLATVWSRLYRVRMASDAYRVTYLTGKVTEIAAEFVEVPG
jgi:hypothetical protein